MTEPDVIINGVRLTTAQAMTLRVALSNFSPECGDDEHGTRMNAAYAARTAEVLALMTPPTPATQEERDRFDAELREQSMRWIGLTPAR